MRTVTQGLLAGAAGTSALNMTTYLDMVLRARPASSTPEQSVERLAGTVGADLGEGEKAENRIAGLGPLLGYAVGAATSVGYALAVRRRLPWPVATLVLTGLAIVGSAAPMTLLRVTDPRQWSAADWAADVVPHLAYGAVTATALEALD